MELHISYFKWFIKMTVTQNKQSQEAMTPANALAILKAGNLRFIEGKLLKKDYREQVSLTQGSQYPFAIVLACIDSRVPPEILFDQGIGDLFCARVAGNLVNSNILGSMEYSCKVAGSKLIVVLGHTDCGAIKGACDHVELGNLTGLLKKIEPALLAVQSHEGTDHSSKDIDFVNKVALKNVEMIVDKISQQSPVLREMLKNNEISIVGAMYDVAAGKVEFV